MTGIVKSEEHQSWHETAQILSGYSGDPPKQLSKFIYWFGCDGHEEFFNRLDTLESDTDIRIMRIEATKPDTLKLSLNRKVTYLEFRGIKDIIGAEGDSGLSKDGMTASMWWD